MIQMNHDKILAIMVLHFSAIKAQYPMFVKYTSDSIYINLYPKSYDRMFTDESAHRLLREEPISAFLRDMEIVFTRDEFKSHTDLLWAVSFDIFYRENQ